MEFEIPRIIIIPRESSLAVTDHPRVKKENIRGSIFSIRSLAPSLSFAPRSSSILPRVGKLFGRDEPVEKRDRPGIKGETAEEMEESE